jgi:hypothetical protein
MSEEYNIEMGEMDEATPASDEFSEGNDFVEETESEEIPEIEQQPRTVPLEVVESIKDQMREVKEHNQQLLQLILSNRQQQPEPQQQQQQSGFDIPDDDIITGAQLKAILQQQTQTSQQEIRQFQEQQRQVFIDEQKAAYQQKYPDYNDVLATAQAEAQKDPAIAELIMRSKNPVDVAYKYGKLLRGEALTETNTAKGKVSVENKIVQNLNKAKTLNQAKGTVPAGEDDFDAMYNKIKGSRW